MHVFFVCKVYYHEMKDIPYKHFPQPRSFPEKSDNYFCESLKTAIIEIKHHCYGFMFLEVSTKAENKKHFLNNIKLKFDS